MRAVRAAVDKLFDRLRHRLLGPDRSGVSGPPVRYPSISGLYEAAARSAGGDPDPQTSNRIADQTSGWIEAHRGLVAQRAGQEVEAVWREASAGQHDRPDEILQVRLRGVLERARQGVEQVAEAEGNAAKNLGTLEVGLKLAARQGVGDPTVFFRVAPRVSEDAPCRECVRLHLLEDEVTPRLWKLSQIGHGYHRRGEPNPKLGGLHPHCRCELSVLPLGYGFDAGGRVTYVGPDHDEYEQQRGG